MSTARSAPSIALIKYWGNRSDEWRLCANGNVAMTLSEPTVEVTVEPADTLAVSSSNKELSAKDIARYQQTLDHIREYLTTIDRADTLPQNLQITIDSTIPPSIGLASSSAVFSAFATAVAGLLSAGGTPALSDEQISIMARLGSGSAARSIFGGFSAIRNVDGDSIDSCIAEQVADEQHWPLWNIVIAPNLTEKDTGSTKGHSGAWTSPHYQSRLADITSRRLPECLAAIVAKDFAKLQQVAEEDSDNMHHCMQTQDPPLHYMSQRSQQIIRDIKQLRQAKHLPVLYTMDAGPTVHLFCEPEAKNAISDFAQAQSDCTVFTATVGPGAHLL